MVEPKYSGNIGGVARVMANFDFHNLYLVNPSCELDDECYKRAMHAQEIVENTKVFKSFEKAIKDMDYVVATSSVESKNDKRFLRNAVSLEFFVNNSESCERQRNGNEEGYLFNIML